MTLRNYPEKSRKLIVGVNDLGISQGPHEISKKSNACQFCETVVLQLKAHVFNFTMECYATHI